MISVVQKGDFSLTVKFLENAKKVLGLDNIYDKYGKIGVEALAAATPKDTGTTANSWYYKVEKSDGTVTINWLNDNVNDGVLIAAIIQYGHGTGTGGYVQGTDYINPAMKTVFQQLADDMWKEVSKV
jgi:hypothetical protein